MKLQEFFNYFYRFLLSAFPKFSIKDEYCEKNDNYVVTEYCQKRSDNVAEISCKCRACNAKGGCQGERV